MSTTGECPSVWNTVERILAVSGRLNEKRLLLQPFPTLRYTDLGYSLRGLHPTGLQALWLLNLKMGGRAQRQ